MFLVYKAKQQRWLASRRLFTRSNDVHALALHQRRLAEDLDARGE